MLTQMILVGLAAFFLSIANSIDGEQIFNTIFSRYNPKFWYKRESWNVAKKFANYKFDAWHISQSLAIICFVVAAVIPNDFEGFWERLFGLIWLGAVYNAVFYLFYDLIWRKAK